jgi:heme-degrading monooxygenase HmoA
MYARVAQGVAADGKLDELIRLIDESVAPEMSKQPGCRGMILLTHGGTGQAISISLWESAEALQEGEKSDYLTEQTAKALPLLAEAPSIRSFRVSGMFELPDS